MPTTVQPQPGRTIYTFKLALQLSLHWDKNLHWIEVILTAFMQRTCRLTMFVTCSSLRRCSMSSVV